MRTSFFSVNKIKKFFSAFDAYYVQVAHDLPI